MTLTQYAFVVCLLVLAPLFGVLGATLQHDRGLSPWIGGVLGTAASSLGWIASGFLAAVLFPTYPGGSVPSEPIAMLFVLPGFVTGGLVLWRLASRSSSTRAPVMWRVVLASVVAALVAVGLVWGLWRMTTWPGRRELPSGAEVIHERAYQDSFLGDFEYELKARMSQEQFREWMRRLHVVPTDEPTRYGVPHDYTLNECGSAGHFERGVGTFTAWCS